jgi:sterol desaturase/sphingolipid hydroxylase (fatty acid hydroxylase superfamily)
MMNKITNFLLPLYFPYVYFIAGYIDYWRNKKNYHDYKNLKQRFDLLFLNIFIYIPITLEILFYIKPITSYHDTFNKEISIILLNVVFGEIWFYVLHRLCHRPFLYKYIHKIHHLDNNPVGILSFHSHPIEVVFINLGSIYIIHYYFNMSLLQHFLVFSYICINSVVYSHSKEYGDVTHRIHHKLLNYNFGVGIFMDKLCSTEKTSFT